MNDLHVYWGKANKYKWPVHKDPRLVDDESVSQDQLRHPCCVCSPLIQAAHVDRLEVSYQRHAHGAEAVCHGLNNTFE